MSEFGHPTATTEARIRRTPAPASWRARAPLGGTIVTAAEQTAGRGRQGRNWTAPRRQGPSLLDDSATARPAAPAATSRVPVAVCEAAEEPARGPDAGSNGPTTSGSRGRKVAGILIEARPQDGWAVIGVGLNSTPARRVPARPARDRRSLLPSVH